MSTINPSMILVTSEWNSKKSFRLIPITKDCPYVEGIYDLDGKVLAIMSVTKKESFHMVARVDEDGDIMPAKKKQRPNNKTYREQRAQLETFQEYYVSEKSEVKDMIKLLAVNADTFDFDQYLNYSPLIETEKPKIELLKA